MSFTAKKIVFVLLLLGLSFQNSIAQYQMEQLNRGIVAVSMGGTKVFISWRWLGTEDNVTFNLYRNGTKVNNVPLAVCNYTDNAGNTSASYTVKALVNGVEQAASEAATPWAQKYYTLPLNVPPSGTTPTGEAYTYSPSDCSVGDVDGDGSMEIFVKWDPSNSKDNSQSGYTGNVYIDCYTMKGMFLWRIDLGRNIRAGAHYTQFLVYDFDGDGKAEMACKTADGTKDGKGTVIGSPTADYRNSSGYILSGPEYLTVFNGKTGAAMDTENYTPGRGTVSSWGDSYGNRVDRFIATVAYLDGQRPSMVFGRGYYTRLVRSAWDFRNGQLTQRWIFDSNTSGNGGYAGMGNHQMTVGDVDGDGKQEVCNGSSTIDHDGKGLYANGLGHGDALHMSDMDPDRPGQEVWQCHEEPGKYGNYGLDFRDAKTGTPLWGLGGGNQGDVGRAMAADIDPRYKGYEVWGSKGALYTCKGVSIGTSKPSMNFGLYWDGDLQRELLDGTKIDEWDYLNNRSNRLATLYDASYGGGTACNGTKATPNLSGDLFGDWREEVILHSADNKNLLIYTTTIPSDYTFRTLLHDPQYRVAIAWQNAAYNQPPHLSYYLGTDMAAPAKPNITIIGNNTTGCIPTITVPSTTFCAGGSVLMTASTGTSYKWFNGTSQVGTDATYTAAAAGNYTVEVVHASGCKAMSAPVTLTVNPLPVITPYIKIDQGTWNSSSAEIACEAGTVNFGPHPNVASGWSWTGPGNFSSTLRNPVLNNVTVNNAGTYTATYTDPNGCKINNDFIIQVSKPTAIITAPVTSFCSGGSATLTASAGAAYNWFNGTAPVGTLQSYTATEPGSYTVEVTNASNCKAVSAPVTIHVTAATVWYQDTDADGKGNAAVTLTACTQPAGYVSAAGDACPADPNKAVAGACGCGNTETDTDADGTPDCTDSDDDNDGIADAKDCAPLNAATGAATVWYEDTDGDGTGNAAVTRTACTQPAGYVSAAGDACPADPDKTTAGACGCGNTETACLDCAGIPNGAAYLDNCSACVGGTTGKTACITTATVNGTSANIQVTPQPFDASTTISVENMGMIRSVTIISSSGAVVESRQGLNSDKVIIGESLAAGLYSVIIVTEQGVHTTKIVKK